MKSKENNGQYVLLGEAFYPKYRTITGNYSGPFVPVSTFDNGIFRTNRVFEGYRYTHAVVIGFDSRGKLLWDNSLAIDDIISMDLEQFVNITLVDDKAVLLYLRDNVLHSKVINGGDVVEGTMRHDLRLKYEHDELTETPPDVEVLKPWYDKVFFAYGVREIKNLRDNGVKLSRQVFFVNKVVYQ